MNPRQVRPTAGRLLPGLTLAALAALMAGCATPPPPAVPAAPPAAPPPVAALPTAPPVATSPATPSPPPAPEAPAAARLRPENLPSQLSHAGTPRDYRQDAARHLYRQNSDRIYKGRMPPLLYAVGVLQVQLDARGQIARLDWMRAPSHAPEVVAEIERTVRRAAPFPAPARLGGVTYTDTWLWHKSGRFQLDTLTEGQL